MVSVHSARGLIRRQIVLIFLTFLSFSSKAYASLLIEPSFIGQKLQTFAKEGLGVDEMQEYFDSLKYNERELRGTNIVPLASKLRDIFKARFTIAERLKKTVEHAYGTTEEPFPECCKFDKSTLKYDVRFRSKVNLNSMCLKIAGTAPKNPIHLDRTILKEMKAISDEYPSVKWQYFGSEQGVMTNFPAYDDPVKCDGYDPRFRPFYVETATPEAKDVVLVIDTSFSMVGDKLDTAKEAAKTVLDTLNPKDQVGIVSFVDKVKTPNSENCYSKQLALAIPPNVRNMKYFVTNLAASSGSTKFKPAFEKAFDLLQGSVARGSGKKRKRVILFLTDGAPTEQNEFKDLFVTIRDRNVELNNSVIILTYGFNKNQDDILIHIANQNGTKYGVAANTSVGDVARGSYTYIEDIRTLRSKMATYYDLFAEQFSQPIVSVPYVDAWGTGLLVSITIACYNHGKFIGVAGTDINIEDLMPDFTKYFKQGRTTYTFMITKSGRTLIHPLLPAPADAYGDPIYMDIRNLERPEADFKEVFESMTNGTKGSKSFKATRYLPKGGVTLDGVTETSIDSTYHWYPVLETEFSVCVVIPPSLKNDVLKPLQIPHGYTFTYHRIDLLPPKKLCSYFGNITAKDTTVVKFAPDAFLDPYTYIGSQETNVTVLSLGNYMTKRPGSESYSKLRSGIRDSVTATWKLDDIWLRSKTNFTQYVIWRYIGTANGVFRQTPGGALLKNYDPRKRPWYNTALLHHGLLTLTTPYLDVGGAGEVITAARALFHGESNHLYRAYDEALGVLGADFPLRYFYRLLTDAYPKCRETEDYSCFIIDDAGFLVMHEDFMVPSASEEGGVENVHITEKEKHIALHMFQNGYLKKKKCRKLEDLQMQTFYEVTLPNGGVDALDNVGGCNRYQLGKIGGTNVYLGISVKDSICSSQAECTCSSGKQCLNPSSCECPCHSKLAFRYCLGEFPNSSLPICPALGPKQADFDSFSTLKSEKCLEKCFDPHCGEKDEQRTCDGLVSCYWCKKDKDGISLSKPYCGTSEKCFRGTENPVDRDDEQNDKICQPSTDRGSKGLSVAASVGISIGCVFALLILIGIYKVVKCHQNTGPRPVRTFSTQKSAAAQLTDHEMSHGNQGHDYEDPRDLMMPPGPPSYNEVLRQQNPSYSPPLPTIPESTDPAHVQPVIPGRNAVRKQSVYNPPPVPLTRRPSGAIEHPGLFQHGVQPAKNMKRKFSLDSSGVLTSNESPPPLAPRARGFSHITPPILAHVPELSTASLPQKSNEAGEVMYSNAISTARAARALREEEKEDEDTNDDLGYVECIHARNVAGEPQAIYAKDSKL